MFQFETLSAMINFVWLLTRKVRFWWESLEAAYIRIIMTGGEAILLELCVKASLHPAGTRRWINVVLTLYQRRRTHDVESMLVYRWSSVYDAEPTLNRHWFNVLCRLGGWPVHVFHQRPDTAPPSSGCLSSCWCKTCPECTQQEEATNAA